MGGHGAAHAHPDIVVVRGVDHRRDQAEHSRVARIVQGGEARIAPVGRHGVLDQVVRADAEEVHFLRQVVGRQCGRRDFDHDADRHRRVDRYPVLQQFIPRLFKKRLRPPEFLHARYHGEHDTHVALNTGPQNGPQLYLEHLRPV